MISLIWLFAAHLASSLKIRQATEGPKDGLSRYKDIIFAWRSSHNHPLHFWVLILHLMLEAMHIGLWLLPGGVTGFLKGRHIWGIEKVKNSIKDHKISQARREEYGQSRQVMLFGMRNGLEHRKFTSLTNTWEKWSVSIFFVGTFLFVCSLVGPVRN